MQQHRSRLPSTPAPSGPAVCVIDGDLLHPGGHRAERVEVGRALHGSDGRGVVVACTGPTLRCRDLIRWEALRAVFVRSDHDDRQTEPDLLRARGLLSPTRERTA